MKQIEVKPEVMSALVVGTRNILYVNEAVSYNMTDFVGELKKTKLYRQRIKQLCTNLHKAIRCNNVMICDALKSSVTTMMDEADIFLSYAEKHRLIYKYTLKNALLKVMPERSDYCELLSYMSLIGKGITLSRENLYDWLVYYAENGVGLAKNNLKAYDNTLMLNAFRPLQNAILNAIGLTGEEDFESTNYGDALKIYRNALWSVENTKKAMIEAGYYKSNIPLDCERPKHVELPDKYK